ncbi:MAG TPA: GGDEF domain-containing protein [Vicinamibacterales bacterium]|jgi:diguanylate cyclase (GGDEF)-like protein
MDDRTMQLPPIGGPKKALSNRVPAIILYDGDEIGGLHSLTKDETTIGRTADCDIVVPETRVSRRHAIIRRTTDEVPEFEIVDLDSTNGTMLNGEPVKQSPLQNGDKVGIGGQVLKFAILDREDVAYQSRIVEMIHIDELTGLLTKRSLFRAFERELIRSLRYRRPIGVLMMDLDHFKLVNDTHGHLVGSHCLSEVGRLIRECTRVVDVSGRYGGEEFVSYLPETDVENSVMVAERIRQTMEAREFRYNDIVYGVRISIGIAEFPAHGGDVESLITAADTALYCAKNQGRNRTIVFEPR